MLTNTAIEALQPGCELKDDRVPGLSVRANASGKSFMLYYRFHGQPRRPKIGAWGVLSITEARGIAKQWLAKVAAGIDPSAERAGIRAEPTVADLWTRCEREHWNRDRQWDKEAKRIYEAHIKPILGTRRVREVTIADAVDVRDRLKKHPPLANHAVAVLSKMLNLAETWGLRELGTNPCQRVERLKVGSRRRYATPAEIQAIGVILEREAAANPSGVAFLYILMFSGARPSEIENATPAMLDRVGTGAVLRLPTGKTGARDVFLPAQAMAVIDRLPAKRAKLAGRDRFPRKLWNKVRKEAGCEDLWGRDWRRTFATVGFSAGIPVGIVGDLLGHKDAKTTKVYAKLMDDAAHQAAAATADRMALLLGGSGAAKPLGDVGQEVKADNN